MIDIDRTLRLLGVAAESDIVKAEAIDAINYLREENARLREALKPFADVEIRLTAYLNAMGYDIVPVKRKQK